MPSRLSGFVNLLFLLSACVAFASEPAADVKARLGAICARQHEARERFNRELKEAPADGRQAAVARYLADVNTNTEEALRLVQAHVHDPSAVAALEFVIVAAKAGPGDQSYRAIELLRQAHVRDPGMGRVCGRIFYFVHVPAVEALMRSVLEQNPDRSDRGQACHELANYLTCQARMVRRIRENPATVDQYAHEQFKAATLQMVREANPENLERQAEALLRRVVAEFPDVPHWFDRRSLGAIAEGELFALQHLRIGKLAPDIVGRDYQNKLFALAEYRGKVVVLTFSGNWCGPCVGLYPQERDLVSRHKDDPFALVSVNTDSSLESLKQSIANGSITWRSWWDGGIAGTIVTRWGISTFPTIFVLDKKGVIRFKDVRGDELNRAVTALLQEPAPLIHGH